MVVINILIAAELVIAPVKVGGYEIEALQNLEEQIEDLRDINPDLRIKALMTMRQKNKTSLEVEEWLKADSGFDMFVTPVRRSIVAEKSTTAMIPLPKFSKRGSCLKITDVLYMSYSRKWRGKCGKEENHLQQRLLQTPYKRRRCDACIMLDSSGKCKSFEKGFAYYFTLYGMHWETKTLLT